MCYNISQDVITWYNDYAKKPCKLSNKTLRGITCYRMLLRVITNIITRKIPEK